MGLIVAARIESWKFIIFLDEELPKHVLKTSLYVQTSAWFGALEAGLNALLTIEVYSSHVSFSSLTLVLCIVIVVFYNTPDKSHGYVITVSF